MTVDSNFPQRFTRSFVKKVEEKSTVDEEILGVERDSTV